MEFTEGGTSLNRKATRGQLSVSEKGEGDAQEQEPSSRADVGVKRRACRDHRQAPGNLLIPYFYFRFRWSELQSSIELGSIVAVTNVRRRHCAKGLASNGCRFLRVMAIC